MLCFDSWCGYLCVSGFLGYTADISKRCHCHTNDTEPERESRDPIYMTVVQSLYSAVQRSQLFQDSFSALFCVVLLFRNYSCPQLLREKLEYYFWPFLFFFLLELVVFPQRIDSGSLWTLNSRFFSALFPLRPQILIAFCKFHI